MELELTGDERFVEEVVRDDGIGFDMEIVTGNHHGLGLLNTRGRLLVFDGTCEVNSAIGKGTEVHARIPVPVGVQ